MLANISGSNLNANNLSYIIYFTSARKFECLV
nr:MAG TPA: hypothetical protein [Caudoviricetes sp.]